MNRGGSKSADNTKAAKASERRKTMEAWRYKLATVRAIRLDPGRNTLPLDLQLAWLQPQLSTVGAIGDGLERYDAGNL